MNTRAQAPRPPRGSVIVVVLVTLMLAAFMLLKFIEQSSVEMIVATRRADRDGLRADAYAALETTLAVMAEIREIDQGQLHSPAQGWADPYGYAGDSPRTGVAVEFAFADESGKLSLPRLTVEELRDLAEQLGLTAAAASEFSDGLFAWMHDDFSPGNLEAEASRYDSGPLPARPPHRSLRSWEELRAVRLAREHAFDEEGRWTTFGNALREVVSLYDFPSTNVNEAQAAVLTLAYWTDSQKSALTELAAGRGPRVPGAPRWLRTPDELAAVVGEGVNTNGLGTQAHLIHVTITAREGLAMMRLHALVALSDGVKLPDPVAAAEAAATPAPPASDTGADENNAETKLDYPFVVLEITEDNVPPPAPAEEDAA
jgi:hypothetical protein